MSGAIFLDRDGVINQRASEGAYIRDWSEFAFLPGAMEALRRLTAADRGPLIVVTNQRGIARGLMTRAAVDDIHARMTAALGTVGARLDAVYVCPHELGACDCRKPNVGLFLMARAADPSVHFEDSWMVGDSLADIEAGNRIGARTCLVAPDEELAAAARVRGLRVDRQARSLLELVERGVFATEPTPGTRSRVTA